MSRHVTARHARLPALSALPIRAFAPGYRCAIRRANILLLPKDNTIYLSYQLFPVCFFKTRCDAFGGNQYGTHHKHAIYRKQLIHLIFRQIGQTVFEFQFFIKIPLILTKRFSGWLRFLDEMILKRNMPFLRSLFSFLACHAFGILDKNDFIRHVQISPKFRVEY